MKDKFAGGIEVVAPATQKQVAMLAGIMSSAFGGEEGRRYMLENYFGKASTKDFEFDEIKIAIELVLSQNEALFDYYTKNIKQDDHGDQQPF